MKNSIFGYRTITVFGRRLTFGLSRLIAGQTRFAICQNLTDPEDRRTVGVAYVSFHVWPLYVDLLTSAR